MTLEDKIAGNDALRKTFKGGRVLMSPSVYALPAWFRGRAFFRLTLDKLTMNDDHSEGEFVFGGYVFYFIIGDFAGERSIQLYMAEDL